MLVALDATTELERIGCSLASSVLDFCDCLKPRLSKTGKYDDKLDHLADLIVESWGAFTIAQVRDKSNYERWEQALTQAGLPPAWVETFGRTLGLELAPTTLPGRPGGTPLSAAAAYAKGDLPESVIKEARFSGQNNLGKRLEAIGVLNSVRLPQKVFDAIKECPDYKTFAITYNDFKAVLSEIFVWTFATYGTVHIDRKFARQLEKELVNEKVFPPAGRPSWFKSILDRFENGRRKSAKVQCAPPMPASKVRSARRLP